MTGAGKETRVCRAKKNPQQAGSATISGGVRKQRIAVVIVTAAVAVGAGFVGLGTASAASSATCSATGTSTLKPGPTSKPQTISTTLTGALTKCSGTGRNDQGLLINR